MRQLTSGQFYWMLMDIQLTLKLKTGKLDISSLGLRAILFRRTLDINITVQTVLSFFQTSHYKYITGYQTVSHILIYLRFG